MLNVHAHTTHDSQMSSSLEVQGAKGYETRYGEEAASLVESGQTSAPVAKQPSYQDDEGILPVILEDYLERVGVM